MPAHLCYQAVGNRCAVDFEALQLPIPWSKALRLLVEGGFRPIEVDVITFARHCIGRSRYQRGARPSHAPAVVDCSSFTKWLYGQCGIWLPRRSIQQREYGEAIARGRIAAGDLVFVSGAKNYYLENPTDGVGHVGIATGTGTVIHAANRKVGVVESPLDAFVGVRGFRGARRYVPIDHKVLTLQTPIAREVETSDDIRWIVLQSLPERRKT